MKFDIVRFEEIREYKAIARRESEKRRKAKNEEYRRKFRAGLRRILIRTAF